MHTNHRRRNNGRKERRKKHFKSCWPLNKGLLKQESSWKRRAIDKQAFEQLKTSSKDLDNILFAPSVCGNRWNWD